MDTSKILYRYNAFDGNPEIFVRCSFSFYTCNGTLAVCMYRKPSHTMWIPDLYRLCCEPYAKITSNIPASTLLDYDEQFVNENETVFFKPSASFCRGTYMRRSGRCAAS